MISLNMHNSPNSETSYTYYVSRLGLAGMTLNGGMVMANAAVFNTDLGTQRSPCGGVDQAEDNTLWGICSFQGMQVLEMTRARLQGRVLYMPVHRAFEQSRGPSSPDKKF